MIGWYFLFISSTETVAYLKNYAIGETPNISIGVALEEAQKILKEIQMRDFSQVDAEADTELMWVGRRWVRSEELQSKNNQGCDIYIRQLYFHSFCSWILTLKKHILETLIREFLYDERLSLLNTFNSRKATLLLERIKKMDQTNPLVQDINFRVGDFESKLMELREKIRVSNQKTNQVRKVANEKQVDKVLEYTRDK